MSFSDRVIDQVESGIEPLSRRRTRNSLHRLRILAARHTISILLTCVLRLHFEFICLPSWRNALLPHPQFVVRSPLYFLWIYNNIYCRVDICFAFLDTFSYTSPHNSLPSNSQHSAAWVFCVGFCGNLVGISSMTKSKQFAQGIPYAASYTRSMHSWLTVANLLGLSNSFSFISR